MSVRRISSHARHVDIGSSISLCLAMALHTIDCSHVLLHTKYFYLLHSCDSSTNNLSETTELTTQGEQFYSVNLNLCPLSNLPIMHIRNLHYFTTEMESTRYVEKLYTYSMGFVFLSLHYAETTMGKSVSLVCAIRSDVQVITLNWIFYPSMQPDTPTNITSGGR